MCSILIVDQSPDSELLASQLQAERFTTEIVNDGAQSVESALSGRHTMVLIDVSPKGMSGFEVLRRIRESSLLPALLLSARSDDSERILGLELGADDFLHKPWLTQELAARVRTILRRNSAGVSSFGHLSKVNDLELNRLRRTVRKGGETITLTTAEFDLLELLVQSAGQVTPREEIAARILGHPLNFNDRSVDMHISNLRKKLELGANGTGRIRAVRGVGYSFTLR
jgi:two-component system, OmpR family, response regulator CpxR